MIGRRTPLALALAALLALAPQTALAAPGDYEIDYDWTSPQTGYAGVGIAHAPPAAAPLFETPFYAVSTQPGTGLGFAPAVSSGGIADRLFPAPDPAAPYAGPRAMAQIAAPGNTQVRSATFDRIDYRRQAGELQFLRLAVYGPTPTTYDTLAPTWANNTDYSNQGPVTVDDPNDDGDSVQAWLATSCGELPDPPDCPTVGFDQGQPRSYARVGRIQIELFDPDPPALAVTGSLTDGAWTNARGVRTVTITAADPDAGVRRLRLQRRRGAGPWRTLLDTPASCDDDHVTGPGEPGREAAACRSTLTRTFTQPMRRLTDGVYTYRAIATDDSDRQTTESFTVRIDRRAPKATLGGQVLSLPRGWLSRGDVVSALLGGSDKQSGIATLDLYVRENGRERLLKSVPVCGDPVGCPGKASRSTGVDLAAIADGELAVRAVARDIAGNASRTSRRKQFLKDRLAPEPLHLTSARANRRTLVATWNRGHDAKDAAGNPIRGQSGVVRYQLQVVDQSGLRRLLGPVSVRHPKHGHVQVRLKAQRAGVFQGAQVLVQAVDRPGNLSTPRYRRINVNARKLPKAAKCPRRGRPPRRRCGLPKPDRHTRTVQFGFAEGAWGGPVRLATVAAFRDAIAHYARRTKKTVKLNPRFMSLRMILPIDLPVAKQASPGWTWWQAYKAAVPAYNDSVNAWNATHPEQQLPLAKPFVSFMGHNFCKESDAALSKTTGETALAGNCEYPSQAAYGKYFTGWLTDPQMRIPLHKGATPAPILEWGAWNEPDAHSFVLGAIGDEKTTARVAAEYFAQAQHIADQICTSCTIIAGELAGAGAGQLYENAISDLTGNEPLPSGKPLRYPVDAKRQPAAPKVWSIHAYKDISSDLRLDKQTAARIKSKRLRGKRDNTRRFLDLLRSRQDRDHLGDYHVWVTEIGALLRQGNEELKAGRYGSGTKLDTNLTTLATCDPPRRPADCQRQHRRDQRKAGEYLMRLWELSPRLTRIYYYGTLAGAGVFDSHLADPTGQPRPVLCGVRGNKTAAACPGSGEAIPNPKP